LVAFHFVRFGGVRAPSQPVIQNAEPEDLGRGQQTQPKETGGIDAGNDSGQLSSRPIQGSAKMLAGEFFDNFDAVVTGPGSAEGTLASAAATGCGFTFSLARCWL